MIISNLLLGTSRVGYIAGTGDGIVTVQGVPARRDIWLLNSDTMMVEQIISSLANGHYMFNNLNIDKSYLVIVRDFKPNGITWTGEAAAWDHVKPASDRSLADQSALWTSWQSI